jgi:hypothetical protein
LVLLTTRLLLNTGRTAAALSSRDDARAAALTGFEEGFKYLVTNGSLTACDGEYGTCVDRTVSTNYSLVAKRRGWTNNLCTIPSAVETVDTPVDRNCPYYDLAIRNRIAYTDLSTFALSSQDFTNNVTVTIPYLVPQLINLRVSQTASITGVDWQLCNSGGCGVVHANVAPGSVINPDVGLFYRQLKLTFHYSSYPTTPVTIMTADMTGNVQVVIGKGYTTVESTGVAGDTKVRMLGVVRGNGQRYWSETSNTFNASGMLQ